MRLASFNIKNGLSDDGSCDPDALVGTCRGLRADVLALQEVDRDVPRSNRADQTAIVAAGCGLAGLYAPARRLDGGEYGNTLLAARLVLQRRAHPSPGSASQGGAGGRPSPASRWTALPYRRRRRICKTGSGGPPPTPKDAAEQLEQLNVVLAGLARRPRPRVLLGDLNMPPEVAVPVLEAAGYEVADSRAHRRRRGAEVQDRLRRRRRPRGGGASEVHDTDVSDHRALVVDVESGPR